MATCLSWPEIVSVILPRYEASRKEQTVGSLPGLGGSPPNNRPYSSPVNTGTQYSDSEQVTQHTIGLPLSVEGLVKNQVSYRHEG